MEIKVPKPDDKVDLVFVTAHNATYAHVITRQKASDMIREWYKERDTVFRDKMEPEELGNEARAKAVRYAEGWLKYGTYCINEAISATEPEPTLARWAVAWEQIVGMYVREREDAHNDLHEQLLKQQIEFFKSGKKIADKMPDCNEGEEWKKGDEDE